MIHQLSRVYTLKKQSKTMEQVLVDASIEASEFFEPAYPEHSIDFLVSMTREDSSEFDRVYVSIYYDTEKDNENGGTPAVGGRTIPLPSF